jgi:hypothetical protein
MQNTSTLRGRLRMWRATVLDHGGEVMTEADGGSRSKQEILDTGIDRA